MSNLGKQLWKGTLVSGVLTIALGAIVLARPGPSILVASTMFGVDCCSADSPKYSWHSRCPGPQHPAFCCF